MTTKSPKVLLRILLTLALLFPLLGINPIPATANVTGTFIVEVNFDDALSHDFIPGDGICQDLTGLCTLRAAIEEANATPGLDTINFSVPMTIEIDAGEGELPDITDPVIIDASSVWDDVGVKPGVTLNGGSQNINGLTLQADCFIYGLYITGFNLNGIYVISGGSIIGDSALTSRNVISGNGLSGITISSSSAMNNLIANNFIGVTPAGDAAQPNSTGVAILNGAWNNVIGSNDAGNIISGNTNDGISIDGATTELNAVVGNLIGLAADGVSLLGNGGDGVHISSGASYTRIGGDGWPGNTIAGNNTGVYIGFGTTSTSWIEDNHIYSSTFSGVTIWGAFAEVRDNQIHSNGAGGVYVDGAASTGNLISQNSIYDHGFYGGIDLNNGGNTELSAPVISEATDAGVYGTACASCAVEVFSDSAGEGEIYEGTVYADASGDWSYGTTLTGPYITATATDGSNNTSEFSQPITLTLNTPPYTPSNPSPAHNATNVSLNPTLSWDGGDPDGDGVFYEIWFGPTAAPTSTLVHAGTATFFTLTSSLSPGTSYTWQVIATDGYAVSSGPYWEFTTENKIFLPILFRGP